jgi:hypothetical protein
MQGKIFDAKWGNITVLTSLAISMIVNALVTGLIVLKIIMVFRKVKATSSERELGATGGRKLQSIIFILIESGSVLFSIQLARLVVAILVTDSADITLYEPYTIIISIHQMLNVIIRSIHCYFLFY